jgi:hypothetical protein
MTPETDERADDPTATMLDQLAAVGEQLSRR